MAILQTSTSAFAFRPDVPTFHPADAVPEALINVCSTISAVIEGDEPSLRVGYVVDDDADTIAEAADVPESEPELAEVEVYTSRISQLVVVSREQYFSHQEGTPEQLSLSVRRALVKKADRLFLSQAAPTPPATQPPAGLLSIDGLVEGEEVFDNLDPLIDLQAQLQSNNGQPSHIILHPLAWSAIRKFKYDDTSNQSLVGAATTDAVPMLLSLPVLVNPNCPPYSGVMIDRTSVVSAVGPVRVETSLERYFEKFYAARYRTRCPTTRSEEHRRYSRRSAATCRPADRQSPATGSSSRR